MKHNYQRTLSLVLFSFIVLTTTAQKNGVIQNQILDNNGRPALVNFNEASPAYSVAQSDDLFRQLLNLTTSESYQKKQTTEDGLGFIHEKYQQSYKGINVEFGTYTIHSDKGMVVSVSGDYKLVGDVDVTANMSEAAALEQALTFVGADAYMWQDAGNEAFAKENEPAGTFFPKGELVIVQNLLTDDKEDKYQFRLAYKFNIYAQNPLSRSFIYVDAIDGAILYKDAIIKHTDFHYEKGTGSAHTQKAAALGNAATRYSGTQTLGTDSFSGSYRLRDLGRGNGIQTYNMLMGINYNNAVDFTDNDNNWTAAEFHNAAKDDAALDAHWGAAMTYDYFNSTYGRNSFDDAGAIIKSYIHFDLVEYGYPDNDNAFWDGSRMTYGDGTSIDPLTTLDIAAHEIGHAICTYTANLTYSNESGALNEGFSDIWAASVEYFAAPTKNTWVLGEDLGITVRSLENPNVANQPDTYQGTYWATGTGDNGGVHTNSGVINHWFYILSVGKSGTNDNGDSFSVTGLGIDKAGAIAYRTESVYLTANSDYAACRTYAIQAATDLYGAGSNEVIQTTNAMYAVGVGAAYGGGTSSYCATKGSDFSYEWIAGVTVGSFTKTSAGTGYSNYTSSVIDVTPGQSYAISLVPGFKSTAYNEYWKIWIDYNGDSDFSDAGELAFDAGALSKVTVNGTITIPANASGQTRMRVSMKYNAAQTECETFSYGEVEDYTINIISGGADTQAPTAPSALAASNITQTTVDLSWNASTDNVGVTGYKVFQGTTELGTTTSTSTQITALTASTAYSFSVKATDAAGNVSAASNVVNVTTSQAPDTQAPTAPTGLAASNVGQNSLTLSWSASSDNVGVTAYDVYRSATLLGTVTGTSSNVTGLTAATAYSFSVKAKDAAGNVSAASTAVNVTTLAEAGCTNGITSFPYLQSFENTLGSWTQATNDNLNWTIDASGTPSSGTGPSSATDGTYYLYIESSTSGTGFPTKKAVLNSPCIDLSGETAATFKFAYHMYGATMGSLALEVSIDGANWTSIWSKSGNLGNAWFDAALDLSPYVGGITYVRFVGISGSNYTSDMAIDKVEITTGAVASCFDVNLTLVFDKYPEETSWTIKDGAGSTMASGGTYASAPDGSTKLETACLPAGCYTFTINDAYGDGICCAYGNGSYSLADGSGTVLASGGSFTSSQSTNFCVGTQGFAGITRANTVESMALPTIYPNPVNSYLNIGIGSDLIKAVKVYNLQGALLNMETSKDRVNVMGLKSGMYFISIETEKGIILERFIKE